MNRIVIGVCIQFLIMVTSTRASLVLTLEQPTQTGSPGFVVKCKGITNTGPETLELIRVDFSPECRSAALKAGIPLILLFLFKLAPGQIYTATVFAVQIDAVTAPAQVLDTVVTIADPAGQVQPSSGIAVRLTTVPEPSSLTLTASGSLVALAVGLWRFRPLTPESGLPRC